MRDFNPGKLRGKLAYFYFYGIMLDRVCRAPQAISMKIEIAAKQLDSLGNPTRLQIFRLLVRAGQTGVSVGTIQTRMGLPGSTLSHHLKRLVETGLVTQERVATTLVCRAAYPQMRALIGYLADECCADDGVTVADSDCVGAAGLEANESDG